MQPRGGPGRRLPADQELAERLRQTSISGPWQAVNAAPAQFAPAYAVPYGLASPFPPQVQPGFAPAPQEHFAGVVQYNQQGGARYPYRPVMGSPPASAFGQRPAMQVPAAVSRSSAPQYAAFYPQFPAGYSLQYLPGPRSWQSMPGQQLQPALAQFQPQSLGPRAPFQPPQGQPFAPPRPQGRQQGRQQQRGRHQRQYDPISRRGQGRGQYRDIWQAVTQVYPVQPLCV